MSFSCSLRQRIFFAVLFLTTVLWAQTSDSTKSKTESFHFSKKSLQFSISNNFTVRDFQGALISAKYHFSDKTALRIGISLSGLSSDEENSESLTHDDSLMLDTKERWQYVYLAIYSQFLHYFNPAQDIKLYAGLGPYFAAKLNYTKTLKEEIADNYDYVPRRKNNSTSLQSGISTAYGVEWFFRKNMSLLAEYGFVFYYFYYESKRTYPGKNPSTEHKDNSNGWSLINRFRFGVSLYF